MNELTREASKQTILEAISFLWLGGRGNVRKSRITPLKPLKCHFNDYLTGLDTSGERIEYWDSAFFKHQGVDLDRFKIVDQILNAKIVG